MKKRILECFDKDVMSTEDLLTKSKIDSKAFSVYRDRLIKRGILMSASRGKNALLLPRFVNFIAKQK